MVESRLKQQGLDELLQQVTGRDARDCSGSDKGVPSEAKDRLSGSAVRGRSAVGLPQYPGNRRLRDNGGGRFGCLWVGCLTVSVCVCQDYKINKKMGKSTRGFLLQVMFKMTESGALYNIFA